MPGFPGAVRLNAAVPPRDRGLMENLRQGDTGTLRVAWDAKEARTGGGPRRPCCPGRQSSPATGAGPLGDGVVETLVLRDFATAVRRRTARPGRVLRRRAVDPRHQAMRSSLAGSVPVEFLIYAGARSAGPLRPTTGSQTCRTSDRERGRTIIPPPQGQPSTSRRGRNAVVGRVR